LLFEENLDLHRRTENPQEVRREYPVLLVQGLKAVLERKKLPITIHIHIPSLEVPVIRMESVLEKKKFASIKRIGKLVL